MRTVRVDRDAFVARVRDNRDNHRKVFEEALEGYRERWIPELERRLHDIRRGRGTTSTSASWSPRTTPRITTGSSPWR